MPAAGGAARFAADANAARRRHASTEATATRARPYEASALVSHWPTSAMPVSKYSQPKAAATARTGSVTFRCQRIRRLSAPQIPTSPVPSSSSEAGSGVGDNGGPFGGFGGLIGPPGPPGPPGGATGGFGGVFVPGGD